MTTLEAYEEVIGVVRELRESGIDVKIKPSQSSTDKECVAKYSGPERVPPDKWINVSFSPRSLDEANAIAEAAKRTLWLGVSFDTGGSVGRRDWDLDWSFKYTVVPDGDLEMRRDFVEQMIPKTRYPIRLEAGE